MHIISKQGSADNVLTYEHICDTAADMAAIERRYITLGSVCIVLQGESGAMEVYMADSDKEWHDVIVTGGGGGSGESAPAGLSLYICTSSEVANGKPDVEAPTEGVLYLVPSGNQSGNLYDEYVYVNDAWELFGGASIDLTGYATQAWVSQQGYLTSHQDISGKADKTDTVLETTLSRGRKNNTTAGSASLAFGVDTEASGYYSVALGLNTTASSQGAFAEGKNTVAHYIAHAEGENTQALGQWAHSQGVSTAANGAASFAGGDHTIANGHASFVTGRYNAADSYDNWPTWTANTSYKVGDRVKRNVMVQNQPTDVGYHCTVANSDATFDIDHWELDGYHMNYVEIVGNGKQYEDPETHQMVRAGSNAYALEWDGTAHFAGDVYVGANSDSTGGVKVATVNQIPTSVSQLTNNSGFVSPASQPTEDGTALVYVNGAWKAQKGYGYGGLTENSLFSLTAADFTEDKSGYYSATINLQEAMQDLSEEEAEEIQSKLIGIFYTQEEFEVKINGTTYNSVQDEFEYEASEIQTDPPIYDISLQNIFALRVGAEGITLDVYDVEPTSVEIITLSKNYTPISEDLLPTIPVKVGEGQNSTIEGVQTSASGSASHAEGSSTTASGEASHAEGNDTKALGNYSHTEGYLTHALKEASHAEGRGAYDEEVTLSSTEVDPIYQCSDISLFTMPMIVKQGSYSGYVIDINSSNNTITTSHSLGNLNETPVKLYSGAAYGKQSHSEGEYTLAYGDNSHSEGYHTFAQGENSHAEGQYTHAYASISHAEGETTIASGGSSHAEGRETQASGNSSHAEGRNTKASENNSHAEGYGTTASGYNAHAEGGNTIASGKSSHAEGLGSQISTNITSTGTYKYSVDSNFQDITEGQFIIIGNISAIITDYDYSNHIITVSKTLGSLNNKSVTIYTGAGGDYTHSEGENTTAFGEASHAEGIRTVASKQGSHAEGYETIASGDGAHAEGDATVASGFFSHAEGSSTTASDYHAHAEGENTVAAGEAAHAEGADTTASVFCSHSEGFGTVSAVKYQHVQGKYNVADTPDNNDEGTYADIVGNGDDDENLSNAYALTWTGDGHYAGDVYVHSNSDSTGGNKLATEAYVTNAISASTETVSGATPTVTAVANKQYICGTVSTLSFTPAVSGISDILFTSGSTATVLTVPNTVKFPEWFDPSNLSANTTYEISVMNGTYGAVMAWATT